MKIEPSAIGAVERTRSPRAWRGGLCLVVLSALLGAGAAPARAGEQDERRLDDCYFFVRSLDIGWRPLLRDLDATVAALGEESDQALPVRKIRDAAYAMRVQRLAKDGEAGEDEALTCLRLLKDKGVASGTRDDASLAGAELLTARGDRARGTDNGAAFTAYEAALEFKSDHAPARKAFVAVGISEAKVLEGAMDFYGALARLETLIAKATEQGWPEAADAAREKSRILQQTGEIELTFFDPGGRLSKVSGDKTDFRTASMTFRPLQGGPVPPASTGTKARIPVGRYSITVTGQGGDPEVREQQAEKQISSGSNSIEVPVLIPAGMRFVTLNGKRAFLIDTYELSVAKYNAWASANGAGSLGGSPDQAAAGITFENAQRYASDVGKSLPTLAQWTHAAFGQPLTSRGRGASEEHARRTSRYPWGPGGAAAGSTFYQGTTAGPVDKCEAGQSPFKVRNMAGNVWEWLSDGWYIGGGFRDSGTFGGKVAVPGGADWVVDYLRDPVPSPTEEARLLSADPDRAALYTNYPPREAKLAVLAQVGLRCVISLE